MKKCIIFLCSILFCLFASILAKDLYGILELERDATEQQIKKSFRRLSMKYHPDKNPNNPEAHDKFLEIQEANEVLSNPDKRQTYDLDGYEALKGNQGGGGHQDPFSMFFGGGRQAGGRPKGPNAMAEMRVTLEQLYNGAESSITIERNVLCSKCRGSGARDGVTQKCGFCQGRGVTMKMQTLAPGFQVQMQAPCDHCGGRGHTAKNKCTVCHGKKVNKEKKTLVVHIERGMKHEEQIIFERESEQSPSTTPGDVIVVIKQMPHSRYTRDGDNLHMNMPISLKESMLGFKKSFKHMDGHEVIVEKTGTTDPFEVIMIKGEGMPKKDFPSIKGDLLVKIHIKYPDSVNQNQRDAINKLF